MISFSTQVLATKLGLSFFETSAKESNNVEAAFRCLVGEIMEYLIMNTNEFDSDHEDNSRVSSSSCRLHLPRNSSNCDDFYYRDRDSSDNDSCIC